MIEPAAYDAAPAARGSRLERAVVVRIVATTGALLAAAVWHSHEPGYGPLFWLWAVCVLAYITSFPPALQHQRPLPLWAWIILAALLAVAVALRFPDIYSVPANVSIDELLPGLEAMRIANGATPNVFGSVGWFNIPNLTFAIPAVVMEVSGLQPFYALRLSSMLTGVAGIACTFLLTRRLFGIRAALATTFFMGVGFWHLHNSRTGFPYPQSSFGPALALYLLVRAQQDRSRLMLATAGACCGLVLQLYYPVRILLFLCPLFLLADGIASRVGWRATLRQSAIFLGGALLVLAPMLASVPPEALIGHSRDVLISRPAVRQDLELRYRVQGLPNVLWANLKEVPQMFQQWADVAVLNRSPRGLLDRGTLAMLLAGIVLAGLQGGVYALLVLLWALLTLLFGVAFSDTARASYRLAAAMPAIYMLAGFAVDRALDATAAPQRWYRFSVRPLILLALAAWVTQQNYRLFFVDYCEQGDGRAAPWPEAMRFMATQCDGRQFYVLPKSDTFGGSEILDLFCTDHSSTDISDIPNRIDTSRAATFLVMGQSFTMLTVLNRCYPNALVTQHRGSGGFPLFTSVEVGIAELTAGPRNCPLGKASDAPKQRT